LQKDKLGTLLVVFEDHFIFKDKKEIPFDIIRDGKVMISGVGSIAILVNDAKKSAEWYRDKLGFEIVGNEGHAVFIRPKGTEFPLLHLFGKCEDWGEEKPGGRTGVWLNCGEIALSRKDSGSVFPANDPTNVERTYQELKEKGVVFSMDLTKTSWGKMALLEDPDGNELEISTEIS